MWSETGKKLSFVEAVDGTLSTIEGYAREGMHSRRRAGSKRYSVETISLLDLLKKHSAPYVIGLFVYRH